LSPRLPQGVMTEIIISSPTPVVQPATVALAPKVRKERTNLAPG
jgi:hypothetical protein